MKTVRRLLYTDVVSAVLFVALAFLGLFFFIDVVDELPDIGKQGYSWVNVLVNGTLELPGNFYELFPIAVLIGSIYSMARLAQTSEFTILRTGGLGPGRALGLLAVLGAVFALATFVVGDYVAPMTERWAVALKAEVRGGRTLGKAGAWLRDTRRTPDGVRNVSVNVQRTTPQGELQGIRIFEFDSEGRLRTRVSAKTGRVERRGAWLLRDAVQTEWPVPGPDVDVAPRLEETAHAQLEWPTSLEAAVVASAVMPVSTMSTIELWRYSSHLSEHEQAAQRHAIQFWKKAFYPLACLVMVALALPFAYLQTRGGGVSLKVFGGIMLGISFVLLNNLAGHVGMLRDWTPWIAAAAPGVIYLLLSLGAFAWLVRYR